MWERLAGRQIYGKLDGEVRKATQTYSFFHWPLEFPDIFVHGGFDVVLGNPPWERIKLQEKEFFSSHAPEIAHAPNKAARAKLLADLPKNRPELAKLWLEALHGAEAQSKFVRQSGRSPLCGRGDVNTYTIFAELDRILIKGNGRAGIIVPSGIATDDTTKFFFRDLMESRSLLSLYDFENRLLIFPAIASSLKICLLTMCGRNLATTPEFVFFALRTEDLRDNNRRFGLGPADMALLNPNTRTCPTVRTRRDRDLVISIYRRIPVLIKDEIPEVNPWHIRFFTMFHMANDSNLFRERNQLKSEGCHLEGNVFTKGKQLYLPLMEPRLMHQFNHRWATYEPDGSVSDLTPDEKNDPSRVIVPRYWVAGHEVLAVLRNHWNRAWLFGWRNITKSVNERTMVATVMPMAAAGHNLALAFLLSPDDALMLSTNLNSIVLDYCVRQKVGRPSLDYFVVKQLPVLEPESLRKSPGWTDLTGSDWLRPRAIELLYTAFQLAQFAKDAGYDGPPFQWHENRRFLIRCEVDAAFFHFYGIARDDVDYIMDTFPIVRRKDEQRFGEYRTKRVILEIYDEMERAKVSGKPYQSRLDPPPGDPRAAHQVTGQEEKGEPADAV